MVNLKNLKKVKFNFKEISEKRKIEAQMGFTIGILIGATSAMVLILFFTTWEWYFKVFSAIGSLGIIGSLLLGFFGLKQARESIIEAEEEMKKINGEARLIQNSIQKLNVDEKVIWPVPKDKDIMKGGKL